jgi:glycine/D-amino acid oxidase-like deaminating enzyme
MAKPDIFHKDFKTQPYWWESYEPKAVGEHDVPKKARVAIVGGGYAGISTAAELARLGVESVVLEAAVPGWGASTRSGGMISGGVSVGKRYSGKSKPEELRRLYSDAADSFTLIEKLIEDEGIDCEWTKSGRFGGAWAPKHYRAMESKVEDLNTYAQSGASMIPRERQREAIATDYYHGGMLIERAAHLHPAKYYKGLIGVALKRGVTICSNAPVEGLTQSGPGWKVRTRRGEIEVSDVVIATNGYTGDATPKLKRRLVPVGSYIIATEEMPEDLAFSLLPTNRSAYDTRRVLTYYRMSGNRRRLIFGGRAKFGFTEPIDTAPVLYKFMTDRFPQLKGVKITHAWTGNVAFTFDEVPHMGRMDGMHFALGCNGSGVAMMTYLGTQTARKIAGVANYACAFDNPELPDHWLYKGDPRPFLPWLGRYFRTRDWIDRNLGI